MGVFNAFRLKVFLGEADDATVDKFGMNTYY
jgi:hypothetical protein